MRVPALRQIIISLDKLVRTGWLLRGVPASIAENVASHSFAAALIALEVSTLPPLQNKNINPYKAALIALVHDVGEAFIGDIAKEFSRRVKGRKEAIEHDVVSSNIGNEYIRELAIEFIEQKTLEAKIAKLAETIATYWRGLEYYSAGYTLVKEIIDNMKKEAQRLSRELGIEDYIDGFLREYSW